MISRKLNIFLFVLGLLLISSVFLPSKGTIKQISSSVPIPSVGLSGTWVSDAGYNETFEIVNENATHFICEFYPNSTSSMLSAVSKDIWIDYTFQMDSFGGWAGWISVDGLTIGENITLGTETYQIVGVDNFSIPLGTYPVFIANATDGRSYLYHTQTGLLMGYHNYQAPGGEFHYLLSTNGDLTSESDELVIPFVGFRAVYLYTDENGTILLNETMLVTGENSTHYFANMYTDGTIVDNSFISKFIWKDRVYMWTYVSYGMNLGWPLWINVTGINLGENVSLGTESFQVVDRLHMTVPVGTFEVWSVSRPLENTSYWYDVQTGLLIAYAFEDEYHFLDTTNAIDQTTTTVISTVETTPPTETTTPGNITTAITTTGPESTDPMVENTTTTSKDETSNIDPDTTTQEDESTSTTPSISPGFSLPIVLVTFGIFSWILTQKKK